MKKNYTIKIFKNNNNEIIAVSRYAGKCVKAKAKCSPDDKYDQQFGIRLASARVDEKVAEHKLKNALKKLAEAEKELENAEKYKRKMFNYYMDSKIQVEEYKNRVYKLLKE